MGFPWQASMLGVLLHPFPYMKLQLIVGEALHVLSLALT